MHQESTRKRKLTGGEGIRWDQSPDTAPDSGQCFQITPSTLHTPKCFHKVRHHLHVEVDRGPLLLSLCGDYNGKFPPQVDPPTE